MIFPSTQEETDQAIAAAKASKQGARKRQSSVPPDSDTAKAKQARAQAEEGEKKAGKGKGRIPAIPKQELATAATALATRVSDAHPNLRHKDRRTIQSLASEWYRAIYHTKYHMPKPNYLDHLCKTAIVDQDVKERDSKFKTEMIKALTLLKALVNDPTKAGLPDPHQASTSSADWTEETCFNCASQNRYKSWPRQRQVKEHMPKQLLERQRPWLFRLGGFPLHRPQQSGACTRLQQGQSQRRVQPSQHLHKPPAKHASGAIGAPVPPKEQPKAKPKNQRGHLSDWSGVYCEAGCCEGRMYLPSQLIQLLNYLKRCTCLTIIR